MHDVIESTKDAYEDEERVAGPMPTRIALCGRRDLQTVLAVLDIAAEVAAECLECKRDKQRTEVSGATTYVDEGGRLGLPRGREHPFDRRSDRL